MLDLIPCPTEEMLQLASCNRAAGWPVPVFPFGEGSPEGVITGYYPGMIYADTTGEALWAFFGTPGENTGWVDQTA